MVDPHAGWFHDGFSIALRHPGTGENYVKFSGRHILENARIRWGRESLFSPPSRRTMSFTGLLSSEVDIWKLRVMRADASRGDTLYFRGQIDSIEIVRDVPGGYAVRFSATESPKWDAWLRETHAYNQMTVEWARKLAAVNQGYKLRDLPFPVYPDLGYMYEDLDELRPNAFPLTGEQVLRLAVAPYPLSFPQYHPDGTAGATMARNQPLVGVAHIGADRVEIDKPQIRLEDTPFRVALHSDQPWIPDIPRALGFFRDEAVRSQLAKTDDFDSWGPYFSLDNGINFAAFSKSSGFLVDDLRPQENSFFWAADVIRGQLTSPRKITFHDTLARLDEFFRTWEVHDNLSITLASDLDEGPFRVIGGILNITHEHTSHEVTAVWARSHPEWGYPNKSDVTIQID